MAAKGQRPAAIKVKLITAKEDADGKCESFDPAENWQVSIKGPDDRTMLCKDDVGKICPWLLQSELLTVWEYSVYTQTVSVRYVQCGSKISNFLSSRKIS